MALWRFMPGSIADGHHRPTAPTEGLHQRNSGLCPRMLLPRCQARRPRRADAVMTGGGDRSRRPHPTVSASSFLQTRYMPTMAKYDCMKCPGYCCSYPVIEITERDIARLAKHFDLTYEEAKAKFTKKAHGAETVLRRKADPHFGRICRFFDTRPAAAPSTRPGPASAASSPARTVAATTTFCSSSGPTRRTRISSPRRTAGRSGSLRGLNSIKRCSRQ